MVGESTLNRIFFEDSYFRIISWQNRTLANWWWPGEWKVNIRSVVGGGGGCDGGDGDSPEVQGSV